jgi:hypothetical protein
MAASPRFKVYTPSNNYVGCVKHPEDAAVLVNAYGPGATIRDGHRKRDIVWTEGVDGDAGESYDAVAELVWNRCE